MPKVLIFAGANGSGKTTFAKSIIEPGFIFINADDIKKDKKLSYIDAGKESLRLISKSIAENKDFSFETTMSGIGLSKRFESLKKEKYTVIIFYLFAYPIELLIERIRERVAKGGHMVANEDVIRRYYRSAYNFWNKYRFYASKWSIINNNQLESETIAVGINGSFNLINESEFDIFKEAVNHG
ncbi:MAG: AAA family ATPase [Candidatus Omnitrophota bacterium]|nr:AAA family ATPase [Candidatus Omnitrophota bacterium]